MASSPRINDTSSFFDKNKDTEKLVSKAKSTAVSFVTPQYSVLESEGRIRIPVMRSGDLSGTDYIDYHTIPGTAEPGEDYEEANGTLVFKPGEDTKMVEVVIIEDDKVEENEFFAVMLANPLGNSVAIGDIRLTSVIIVDVSSPGEFMFIDHVMSVSERAGVVKLLVRRVNGCQDRVTVDWNTRSGTAIAGREFGEKNNHDMITGTIVFENQETEQIIEIPIINNNTLKDRRTDAKEARDFNVLLS